jgi:hypothetical protein
MEQPVEHPQLMELAHKRASGSALLTTAACAVASGGGAVLTVQGAQEHCCSEPLAHAKVGRSDFGSTGHTKLTPAAWPLMPTQVMSI